MLIKDSYPSGRSNFLDSPSCCERGKSALITASVATGIIALVAIGCVEIQDNRVTLRDPSEILSFVQNVFDFLGAILPK